MNNLYPQFPLFIPSKGRYEYMITSKYLTKMGIKHYIIVEPQEVELYKKSVSEFNLLTEVLELDMDFKKKYELCDELGLSKSTGSGPARNFAWETSIKMGFDRHWIMDDNIRSFRRMNNNEKVKIESSAFFRIMEDFCLRYKNIGMAGPNYHFFAPSRIKKPQFTLNTRIYSCNLIKNDLPYRWRGRYNEDTILSLDILKGKWCTVLFNTLLQEKMPTQTLKGGNSTELYLKDFKSKEKYSSIGTIAKSQMMVTTHPDVSTVVIRYGRVHHYVDYSIFKYLKLIKKDDADVTHGVNNYGLELVSSNEG